MWEEQGVWLRAWRKLLGQLDQRKLLGWEEAFLDATFVTAKKGPCRRHNTSRERYEVRGGDRRPRRTCRSATRVRADFRTPACRKHARYAEGAAPWPWTPRSRLRRVMADRGYDSDPLRERLKKRGTELIAPYRSNNRHRRFEDKRKLRRYRKRWKIERTNARLQNFRRIQVRYDRLIAVFQGFFHFACLLITLRHLCN
jgi:transposase